MEEFGRPQSFRAPRSTVRQAWSMTREMSARILVLLSMAFGLTIAVLAMTDSGGIGLFAVIGGVVLGLLWTARSFFTKPPT